MWYKVQIVWQLKDQSRLISTYTIDAIHESSAVSKALQYNVYNDDIEQNLDKRLRITITPATDTAIQQAQDYHK